MPILLSSRRDHYKRKPFPARALTRLCGRLGPWTRVHLHPLNIHRMKITEPYQVEWYSRDMPLGQCGALGSYPKGMNCPPLVFHHTYDPALESHEISR